MGPLPSGFLVLEDTCVPAPFHRQLPSLATHFLESDILRDTSYLWPRPCHLRTKGAIKTCPPPHGLRSGPG